MPLTLTLEVVLVAAIAAMTALSLFTLYLQDKLTDKVEYLERTGTVQKTGFAEQEVSLQKDLAILRSDINGDRMRLDEMSGTLQDVRTLQRGMHENDEKISNFLRDYAKVRKKVQDLEESMSSLMKSLVTRF